MRTEDPAETARRVAQIEAEIRPFHARAATEEGCAQLLVETARGANELERTYALGALAEAGYPPAYGLFIRMLASEEVSQFSIAAKGLARLRDRRAVPYLIAILEQSDARADQRVEREYWPHQRGARGFLGRYMLHHGWWKMIRDTNRSNLRQLYALRAAHALGEIGDVAALPALRARLADPHERVRTTVVDAIAKIEAGQPRG